jgi:hypothetical protein
MQTEQANPTPKTQPAEDCCKPGFFKRLVRKLDAAMKTKAEEKAEQGSCCSGNDKSGKCC